MNAEIPCEIKRLLTNQLAKSACDTVDRMKWVGERNKRGGEDRG